MGGRCKLEFAYRAQRFQVSAQAARFKKGKAHGVKWRPCLGGGLVCVKFFLPCFKFPGQNVFWTVQSSCGVYRASCAPLCIEIKVRSVGHAFQNVTCSCVRFVCVSSVAESVLRVASSGYSQQLLFGKGWSHMGGKTSWAARSFVSKGGPFWEYASVGGSRLSTH